MNKQPEALRLAERLDSDATSGDMGRKPDPACHKRKAAAELRRLHGVERRYEHIKAMARAMSVSIDGNHAWTMMLRDIKGPSLDEAIDAAITKATGETK